MISESDFTRSAHRLAQPNYCLLFTASALTQAADSSQTFLDLIKGYSFPALVAVNHDFDVVKRYEDIRNKLGRTPTNSDIDPTTRYHIKKRYGNLTNLIAQLCDAPFTRRPPNEKIKEEYSRIKQLIGRVPTLVDIEANTSFSRNCFSSYPFTKLQKECGDAPNIERGVSKEELVAAFESLSTSLGRTPTLKDLDEKGLYRSSYYRVRWGTLDRFLEELGISKRKLKQRAYQEHELLVLYLLLKKAFEIRQDDPKFILNHTVLENLRYEGKLFISPSAFSRRFGGWKGFIDASSNGAAQEFATLLAENIDRFISSKLEKADNEGAGQS